MSSDRPITTLFMLTSVDGKISTGSTDKRDFDKDLPNIKGVREGLSQYYALEKLTDLHSLNTGRVMAKIGINTRKGTPDKARFSFIIIDNKPHLTTKGILYLTKWLHKLYLVTTNQKHPAFAMNQENLEIIHCKRNIKFPLLLRKLKQIHEINKITIQSGGTLNATLLRQGLVDHLSIVVAPCLVGGKDTPTLIDGESLRTHKDLKQIKALQLTKCDVLKDSYVHLQYTLRHT